MCEQDESDCCIGGPFPYTVEDEVRKQAEKAIGRKRTAMSDAREGEHLEECAIPWCHGRKMELTYVFTLPQCTQRNYICAQCGRTEKVTCEWDE